MIISAFKILSTYIGTVSGYIVKSIVFKLTFQPYIRVNYFKGKPNWGDDLNEYLIEKVSGHKVVRYPFNNKDHVLGIGSIIARSKTNSHVWGAGFISEKQVMKVNPKNIYIVRGPLTAAKLHLENVEFGDPGLCIRRYYLPKNVKKKYKLGIVPHHIDKNNKHVKRLANVQGVKIIDIQDDIEPFIDDLLTCEYILSSSLHGLIAADSYSIPNCHLKFSDGLIGGDFKFRDYYLGIGVQQYNYLEVNDIENLNFNIDLLSEKCMVNTISDKKIDRLISLFPRL
ncbi:polysaccharide pyruvyl transferase family protein [Shewanella sp. MEBiC00475]|uniref:polysaccharide pyruvyl transferase family protein n=1 Tax=Shewanella sp. MEBiC00475 TaxID=2575361 RepID=UPI0010C0CE8D|nr:polysaccharide pyruvyl transferase family protein [Shewanella sp. MEBiC00475]